MACNGCNGKSDTAGNASTSQFCQRCFWFWVAIGVTAFIAICAYRKR